MIDYIRRHLTFSIMMFTLFWTFIIIASVWDKGCANTYFKYEISAEGKSYYTNDIKSVNGCVKFINNDETPMIICGQCTIKENKNYKKK